MTRGGDPTEADLTELRGERTTFTADLTPVRTGESGRSLRQPVADEVPVAYDGEGTETETPTEA